MSKKEDNLESLEFLEKSINEDLKELKELEDVLSSPKKTYDVEIEIESLEIDKKEEKEIGVLDSLKDKLNNFVKTNDFESGKYIIEICKKIEDQLDEDGKFSINVLKRLVNVSLKYKNIYDLLVFILNNFNVIFSNTKTLKKDNVLNEIREKFNKLKSKKKGYAKSKEEDEIINRVYEKISTILDSKLQEINIKIEENQRIIHNLASVLEDKLFKSDKKSEVIEEKEEEEGIREEVSVEKGVLKNCGVLVLNSEKYVILDNYIMNYYKISSSKASKLARRIVIKFGQLKGMFSSLTKGLKEELRKRDNLEDMFLRVLQPDESEGEFRFAVVVKIPEVDEYGVIFGKDFFIKECELMGNSVKVDGEEIPLLDLKNMWLAKQIDMGSI